MRWCIMKKSICAELYLTLCYPIDCTLLGSCPWNFPRKHTRMGCHFLLQGILLMQGLNPCLLCLLHWQADSLSLCHLGSQRV